jgi:hypothetical protein
MVAKSGEQCKRIAADGGMGFCWQHVVVKQATDRDKWKQRVEIASLAVAATDLLIKLVELAVTHLPEFFGLGDHAQNAAKNW